MAGFATAAPVLSLVILNDKYFAAFHAERLTARIYDGTVKRSPASRASFLVFHCCRRRTRTADLTLRRNWCLIDHSIGMTSC